MTVQTEIATLAGLVLTEEKNAEAGIATVTSNPTISPFLPMIESFVTAELTQAGVPVADVEKVATSFLAGLNSLLIALSNTASNSATSGGTGATQPAAVLSGGTAGALS